MHQKKDGYRFLVNNSGEVTSFDWYNAQFRVNFKVNKLAYGANLAVDDHNGIVNGSHSFIKKFDVKMNGCEVYDCNNANHVVNIQICLNIVPHMLHQQQPMNFTTSIQIDMLKNESLV